MEMILSFGMHVHVLHCIGCQLQIQIHLQLQQQKQIQKQYQIQIQTDPGFWAVYPPEILTFLSKNEELCGNAVELIVENRSYL
jgi:hypothetical protein